MAPGLSEIATEYQITSPTIVALTLSIFLVSFAIGVSLNPIIPPSNAHQSPAIIPRSII